MRSGFNSIATFNRLFKAQIGYTPTEYRQMAPTNKKAPPREVPRGGALFNYS